MIDKDKAKDLLEARGFSVSKVVRYRNCAWRIVLQSGTCVYLYDKGSFCCQGSYANDVREAIESGSDLDQSNYRVFVAYGHDLIAKRAISDLLSSWNLEPLFLDELPSEGRTIIEQLKHYIPQANYGLALLTPDDIAHSAEDSNRTRARFRARQNVVLELGMLYMKLGRKRVAIISKKCEGGIEHPSDIDGVLRLEYGHSPFEASARLRRELRERGYDI